MNKTKTACQIIAMITESKSEDILYSDDVMDVPFHEYMTRFLKERKMTKAKLLDLINGVIAAEYQPEYICCQRNWSAPVLNRLSKGKE